MKELSKFQKTLIILYIVFVLLVTVIRIPWTVWYMPDSPAQGRAWATVFKQPERAYYAYFGQEEVVGHAYVDYRQILVLLFTGTIAFCGAYIVSKK